MSNVVITEDKFKEYLEVQESGICNMLDYRTISEYTSLTREEHREIIKNYGVLAVKYKYHIL